MIYHLAQVLEEIKSPHSLRLPNLLVPAIVPFSSIKRDSTLPSGNPQCEGGDNHILLGEFQL